MRRNLDDDYLFNVLLHCDMHLSDASYNAMQRYNYFCDWQKKENAVWWTSSFLIKQSRCFIRGA